MNLSFHQLQPTTDNTIESSDHIQTRTVETSNLSNCLNDNPPQVSVTKTPPEGQKVLTSKPVFWIPDDLYLSALHFNKLFEVRGYKEVSQVVPALENYIIQSSDMKEATIKAIAWKIQAQGGQCKIYSSQLEFTSLVGEETSITEVTLQILDYALEYDDWAGRRDKENLTVRQASEIARGAIALLPKAQKLVELGILRERCKQSSWEWSKLVMELEEQFQREVERRGVGGSGGELPPLELSVIDRTLEIIGRGLSPSLELEALASLAQGVNRQPKHIEDLARLLRVEMELEVCRDDRKLEINDLLNVGNKTLNIVDFLPEELANPISQWCGWLNIPEAVALTAVLTAVSTLHPVGTQLVLHRAMDFQVPPILFSAIVGESGQKKSPIYRTLIKKPLRVLQNEAQENYKQKMLQYELDLANWERNRKDNPKPVKPGLPVFFFTDATGEGIKAQAQETPDKAMFALIDELAGLFNSNNQYRGGKGSDRQDLLSYYDGAGQTVLRATGIKVDVEHIYLSVFGGIQPDILKEYTKDLKDADGHWARFLFVNQPLAASELPTDDDSGINIKEMLAGCYRRIASLPSKQYKLSPDAFKRFQIVYNHLEQLRVNDSQPGMRAVYSKMEGAIGRLALNLHIVKAAFSGVHDIEISVETMNQAIALAEFYIGQVKALHAESFAEKGELSAVLAKLLKIAIDKGQLTARDAVRSFNFLKSSAQALDKFRELECMGYGTVEKVKASWLFIPTVNGVNGSVNGGIDTLKQRSSSIFSQSVNGVNGVNDFLKKPNERLLDGSTKPNGNGNGDIDTTKPAGNDTANSLKKTENIDTTDSIDTKTESTATLSVATVNGGTDSSIDSTKILKPLGFSLKVGDRVECYPTRQHAENNWVVTAKIISIESEDSWFLSCVVEYAARSKKGMRVTLTSLIDGGSVDWIFRKL